jgi:hypothetical protein
MFEDILDCPAQLETDFYLAGQANQLLANLLVVRAQHAKNCIVVFRDVAKRRGNQGCVAENLANNAMVWLNIGAPRREPLHGMIADHCRDIAKDDQPYGSICQAAQASFGLEARISEAIQIIASTCHRFLLLWRAYSVLHGELREARWKSRVPRSGTIPIGVLSTLCCLGHDFNHGHDSRLGRSYVTESCLNSPDALQQGVALLFQSPPLANDFGQNQHRICGLLCRAWHAWSPADVFKSSHFSQLQA